MSKQEAKKKLEKMIANDSWEECRWAIDNDVYDSSEELHHCDDCGELICQGMSDVWTDTLTICLKCI